MGLLYLWLLFSCFRANYERPPFSYLVSHLKPSLVWLTHPSLSFPGSFSFPPSLWFHVRQQWPSLLSLLRSFSWLTPSPLLLDLMADSNTSLPHGSLSILAWSNTLTMAPLQLVQKDSQGPSSGSLLEPWEGGGAEEKGKKDLWGLR